MKKHFFAMLLAVAALLVSVQSVFAADYAYSIGNIVLTDMRGNVIDYTGGACMASVDVIKNSAGTDGYIVLACYSDEGRLISFNYLYIAVPVGKVSRLCSMITPYSGERLGTVKAYVWKDLMAMTALAEEKTLDVNEGKAEAAAGLSTDVRGVVSVGNGEIRLVNNSGAVVKYKFDSEAQLCVNGVDFCAISAGNGNIISELLTETPESVFFRESKTTPGCYSEIAVNIYDMATVTAVASDTIELDYIGAIELSEKVKIIKNGLRCAASAVRVGDIAAVKYDIAGSIDESSFCELYISDKTISGQLTEYDSELGTYHIDNKEYYSTMNPDDVKIGTDGLFKLDSFGRIFSFEEDPAKVKMAIVERYVDQAETYITVMTFDGKPEKLNIADSCLDEAVAILKSAGITSSTVTTARNVPIENRIAKYRLDGEGCINEISFESCCVFDYMKYNEDTNSIDAVSLWENAKVIDAMSYDYKTSSYKTMKLSDLEDGVEYSGILTYPNSSSEYCFAVIYGKEAVYTQHSNFAVAAADMNVLSRCYYKNEDVYTMYVMQNGGVKAEKLYIDPNVEVYMDSMRYSYFNAKEYLKQGAVFYYTAEDGVVTEINIVMPGGGSFEELLQCTDMSVVRLPAGSEYKMYNTDNWGIGLDRNAVIFRWADPAIQLLLAPVIACGNDSVSVAPVKYDSEYYIDTNEKYEYAVSENTKIYAYDMSGGIVGKNALSHGKFTATDISAADENGKVRIEDAETVYLAFMMVADGTVTNALVMSGN